MTFQPLIIGIAGKARSGKTTIAEHLVQVYNFSTLSFAEPMYQAVKLIFGFTDEDFQGAKKEAVNEYWGISPRKALQLMGTEAGRNVFGEDIWIKSAQLRLNNLLKHGARSRFVVSDVRYENEADFIRAYGANSYIWHVRRTAGPVITENTHASEGGILFSPHKDYIIDNDGSLSDLAKAVNDTAAETFCKLGGVVGVPTTAL